MKHTVHTLQIYLSPCCQTVNTWKCCSDLCIKVAECKIVSYSDIFYPPPPTFHTRRYKSDKVCVVKCRGGPLASCDPPGEVPEEGAMTGLTVTDRETGKGVTIPLSTLETETGSLS